MRVNLAFEDGRAPPVPRHLDLVEQPLDCVLDAHKNPVVRPAQIGLERALGVYQGDGFLQGRGNVASDLFLFARARRYQFATRLVANLRTSARVQQEFVNGWH